MSRHKIALSVPGPVLPGTLSTAMAKCGQKNCSCRTSPKFRHGPYYRWTGILDGKPTTITLNKTELKECSRRIKNWKKLQTKLASIKSKALQDAPWKTRKLA